MAQCLDMIAGTGVFSVFDGMPATMKPTWRHRGYCSRAWGRQRQMTGLQLRRDLTDESQDGWTTMTGGDFAMACQRRDVVGQTDIEERFIPLNTYDAPSLDLRQKRARRQLKNMVQIQSLYDSGWQSVINFHRLASQISFTFICIIIMFLCLSFSGYRMLPSGVINKQISLPAGRRCCAVCVVANHRRSSCVCSIFPASLRTLHAVVPRRCRRPESSFGRSASAASRCRSARSRRGSRPPCGHAPWPPGHLRVRCAVTSATRGSPTSVGRETPSRTAHSGELRSRAGCHATIVLGMFLCRKQYTHSLEVSQLSLYRPQMRL